MILFILIGAAVVVAAVLVGLGVRRGKGQTAGDSVVHYYSTPGLGLAAAEGGGEGRKKESVATDYYVNQVVADLARGSAYEAPWGGASRPDNQPTERVPGRDYTDLNMDTVSKREYESLHKTT